MKMETFGTKPLLGTDPSPRAKAGFSPQQGKWSHPVTVTHWLGRLFFPLSSPLEMVVMAHSGLLSPALIVRSG